jgi:hypothetical protein
MTVLSSLSLYVASISVRDPIRVIVSGVFLVSFFGQAVAVMSGSAQESRTMLIGTLAALVVVISILTLWPFGASPHLIGLAIVARGLFVASVLTALGYSGHRVAKGQLW